MESILISSKPIEISEHKNYKLATFLISVLDEWNENGVLIPKEIGEKYYETIVGFPVVAKLIVDADNNPVDFRGHEVSVQKGIYRFNTVPIGSVLKSYIEEREVEGYEGKKSCIMIQAKLWTSRFPEYFKVLDTLWSENNVSSSWEISVEKSELVLRGRILKVFSFIGNCILGRDVEGAVRGAGMIEYAEFNDNSDDIKLAKALSSDCIGKEVKEMEKENVEAAVSEKEIVEEKIIAEKSKSDNSENVVDVSAMTIEDFEKKIHQKLRENEGNIVYGYIYHIFVDEKYFLTHNYKQDSLEFYKFTYDIVDNEVVINEVPEKVTLVVDIVNVNSTIASKDEEIIKANSEIENLKSEVTELLEIKSKYDSLISEKAEIEKAEKIKNLKEKAVSSGYISEKEIETSEEISDIISSLNEAKLNSIIVDRILSNKKKVSNEDTENININLSSLEESEIEPKKDSKAYIDAIKAYIG